MQLLKTKLFTATSVAFLLTACAGTPPAELGVIDGKLRACPESPNCVQTYNAADADHYQAPLIPKADIESSKQAIKTAIVDSGGKIITEKTLPIQGYYLHAEYQSTLMRFVDDVEVVVSPTSIQLRSASRLGHSDLGVNAERYQQIKANYQGL